jgi:hypothetical protein
MKSTRRLNEYITSFSDKMHTKEKVFSLDKLYRKYNILTFELNELQRKKDYCLIR